MTRVVAVTGAAGGIGCATVQEFAAAGWRVVGIDRRALEDADEATRHVQADVSSPAEIEQVFLDIAGREGRLDALVNNAAIQICKPLIETTLEEWDATMAANVRSVFLASRAAYPLLCNSGGAIVNVSSVHAVATSTGIAAYAASKGALLALTRAMALEFGPRSIRVNAILPGAVDTAMLHAGLTRASVAGRTVEELVRGLGRKQVMDRVGRPAEIGRAIRFLADNDMSSYMTGQALVVDGGATARLSTE